MRSHQQQVWEEDQGKSMMQLHSLTTCPKLPHQRMLSLSFTACTLSPRSSWAYKTQWAAPDIGTTRMFSDSMRTLIQHQWKATQPLSLKGAATLSHHSTPALAQTKKTPVNRFAVASGEPSTFLVQGTKKTEGRSCQGLILRMLWERGHSINWEGRKSWAGLIWLMRLRAWMRHSWAK